MSALENHQTITGIVCDEGNDRRLKDRPRKPTCSSSFGQASYTVSISSLKGQIFSHRTQRRRMIRSSPTQWIHLHYQTLNHTQNPKRSHEQSDAGKWARKIQAKYRDVFLVCIVLVYFTPPEDSEPKFKCTSLSESFRSSSCKNPTAKNEYICYKKNSTKIETWENCSECYRLFSAPGFILRMPNVTLLDHQATPRYLFPHSVPNSCCIKAHHAKHS